MGLRATTLSRLRRFRPAWSLYNLRHWRSLRANREHYRRLGIRRSVLGSISHRQIPRRNGEVPWLDRPDAAERLAAADTGGLPPQAVPELASWVDRGFLVLEGFLAPERVDEINAEVDRLLGGGEIDYHYRGNRIVDAHRSSRAIEAALTGPELTALLGFLLGRQAALFQTINFIEGSQQRAHSDSFHMTTEPMGYLLGCWLALEDVAPDAGPVFYYPGSHRLPYVMSEDLGDTGSALFLSPSKQERYEQRIEGLVAAEALEPVDFLGRKGDLLVWHANLLHGGRPVERQGATRRSLVAHFFAEGVLCYHEVTERPALLRAT